MKTNSKLFADGNWKRFKPAQKLLAMDSVPHQPCKQGKNLQIDGRTFWKSMHNRKNPDDPSGEGNFEMSKRTLQKYLKMLKLYFYIRIKEGMYYITLRSVFQRRPVAFPKITRPMTGWCRWRARRNRTGACDKKEARQVGTFWSVPETASGEKRIHIGYLYPDR